jgi:predicted ribosome quality control (RQC) complex YloA/Tae2 family protein
VDNFYLSALVQELTPEAQGRTVVRASIERSNVLLDLRLSSGRQLLASLDRTTPALYLAAVTAAPSRDGKGDSTFLLNLLRKHVVGGRVVRLGKDPVDRIVRIDFEKLDAGDNRINTSLRVALTGRSSNAYLCDAQGNVIGAMFEQDKPPRQPQAMHESFDPARLIKALYESNTQADVLDRFFGAGTIFSPQLRNEFLARSNDAAPSDAFRSLIDDLFNSKPVPLLYSRLPLEQIHQVIVNPKTDLLLSHIELAQASGMLRFQFSSLSEAADQYYAARSRALALGADYAKLKQVLTLEIKKREHAMSEIESDRARFEHPEKLKRTGDLILANLATARITGNEVTVIDYYHPDQNEIQIDLPEGATLKEAAADYFGRYQKARRALEAITSREREVSRDLEPLKRLLKELEHEPTLACITEAGKAADQLLGTRGRSGRDKETRARRRSEGAYGRRFKSSDGYEIVVGRNDRDNDALTFRVAKPHDIWLHAADYPGSHAIIRSPTRDVPPHRTITEAAELAAFYSQAKREGKAAVHYAQKKFVSKPPRSKPGLVRLSSFKTILVEPRCDLERLD